METEIAIINDVEEAEIGNAQQWQSDEIIEIIDSPSPIEVEVISESNNSGNIVEKSTTVSNASYNMWTIQEEPIDLTLDKSKLRNNDQERVPANNKKIIVFQTKPDMQKNKDMFQSQKELSSNDNKENQDIIITSWTKSPNQYPTQHKSKQDVFKDPLFATKQQDVLKMAKSIFSKRTRTLYQWMYPGASKQQIKQVVSNTWEMMGAQEKNIYVAMVLGRFSRNNANLMVNPQLGQIRNLPPIRVSEQFHSKASELQTAISSISCETADTQPSYVEIEPPRKKPKFQKMENESNLLTVYPEFDDDPELSQELTQFSVMLKNQF